MSAIHASSPLPLIACSAASFSATSASVARCVPDGQVLASALLKLAFAVCTK
ncbi:MAG TPA: hypothetical protein VGL86_30920 [Polyangia bacterium]